MKHSTSSQAATKRRLKIWIILVALFMGWAVYTIINQMYQKDALYEKMLTMEANRATIKNELEQMQKQVELLNDPEYLSQLATKEQGMVKEGEQQIFNE